MVMGGRPLSGDVSTTFLCCLESLWLDTLLLSETGCFLDEFEAIIIQ